MADKKSRAWLSVVYPESAVEGWRDLLAQRGCQCLISPLHDSDVNADGEAKKAHWHIVLVWDGPTTYSNAREYIDLIGGVGCLPCASLRGAARYLVHLDNPDKHQYSTDDVQVIGGLDYRELCESASDALLTLYEIMDYCDAYCITSFRQLVIYCRNNRPDWARVILTSQRENIWRYLRSLEHDLQQQQDF